MSKQSGLGQQFLCGGYLIGGDVQAINNCHGGPQLIDSTDITQFGHARLGALRDGGMDLTSYFDPAPGMAHAAFSPLPRGDVIMTWLLGQAIGNPCACLNAKQIGYDPTRGNDGSLTEKVEGQGNSYGLEWGVQLTPGARTDTAATNGTSWDTGGSLSFGGQAYLQAVAFAGTDVTVQIEDSADNTTFALVTGLAFSQITGGTPLAQRISVSNVSTIRRYVRAITVTTGGFTSLQFAVALMKNNVAGITF